MTWVPLHVHSQYSILDASASVKDIVKKAKEFGMEAVALTDHGNLFGAIEFYKACLAEAIKPIIGCEFYIAPESRLEKNKESKRVSYHITLLAKNLVGYQNLCRLSSIGYLEGFYYTPRIDKESLKEHKEGLICLSGCMNGSVPQAILAGEDVEKEAQWFKEVFEEDYYFELQRHPMTEESLIKDGMTQETWLLQQYRDFFNKQKKVNDTLIELSKRMGISLVATNDSHYILRQEWKAHEILLNIQSGEPVEIFEEGYGGQGGFRTPNPKRKTYPTHELYFKSQEEMKTLFSDVPQALENSLEIAKKCSLKFDFSLKHYPVFVPPI